MNDITRELLAIAARLNYYAKPQLKADAEALRSIMTGNASAIRTLCASPAMQNGGQP